MTQCINYIFVISDSRSGSTLLSKTMQDSYGSTLVLPEFRLDNIITASLSGKYNRKQVIRIISDTNDLSNLGLKGNLNLIGRVDESCSVEHLVRSIIEVYAESIGVRVPSHVVIKKGNNVDLLKLLAKKLESINVIYLLRDVRAVYVSKTNSVMPRNPYLYMAWKGPFLCGKQWNSIDKKCIAFAREHASLYTIKYEELVINTESVKMSISKFTGMELNDRVPKAEKPENIIHGVVPLAQRHLHGNLNLAPSAKIATAWVSKISIFDRLVLESVCRDTLEAHGYKVESKVSNTVIKCVLIFSAIEIPLKIFKRVVLGSIFRFMEQ